jgi:hypothetical protein
VKGVEQKKLLSVWDCPFSQVPWKNFNSILELKKLCLEKIVSYEKIFDFGVTACATLIKLKIINELAVVPGVARDILVKDT